MSSSTHPTMPQRVRVAEHAMVLRYENAWPDKPWLITCPCGPEGRFALRQDAERFAFQHMSNRNGATLQVIEPEPATSPVASAVKWHSVTITKTVPPSSPHDPGPATTSKDAKSSGEAVSTPTPGPAGPGTLSGVKATL